MPAADSSTRPAADGEVSATRVCFKNLPLKFSEDELKEFLASESTTPLSITDCKLLKNAKGRSRKIAFVGFASPSMAAHAVERFHKTYLRFSRLSVEPALRPKEKAPEAPADKPKRDDKAEKSKESETKSKDELKIEQQKREFLQAMGVGSNKSKFWSNDDDMPADGAAVEENQPQSSSSSSSSDDSSSSSSDSDSDDDDDDDDDEKKSETRKQKQVSDLDFLRSKKKNVDDLEAIEASDSSSDDSSDSSSDSDSDEEVDMADGEDKQQDEGPKSKSRDEGEPNNVEVEEDKDEEEDTDGMDNSRLFLRNLSFATTEDDLYEYFEPFGKVTECHIPVDDLKRSKGLAFVTMSSASEAYEARTQLDKTDLQGRLVHILPARRAPSSTGGNVDDSKLSWKQKQERDRKERDYLATNGAKDSAKGWSASFVRGDAVVDNLAERLGLRKGDILGVKDDLSSGDAAVRLALGETQIIEENRTYFREHGIDMEALVSVSSTSSEKQKGGKDESIKRSNNGILVKNLPFDTTADELIKLFHVGEEPLRVLLPPSRTIALVEFGHSNDAKKAFRKLAYRRFKHVPIYLEWAPLAATVEGGTKSQGAGATHAQAEPVADIKKVNADPDDEEETELSTTLYVKNLNFNTTEVDLQKAFESAAGVVRSVRIPRKVTASQGGDTSRSLSMGFGFVELDSHRAAQVALKKMQGKLVDGHALELKISKNSSTSAASKIKPSKQKNPTKLMVRNVPFQATRKELLKLFGSFGQLKKVRLPKKFDGSHRGFAFIEFLTHKEAVAGMTALSRTHLYGRHLVLEWASEDDQEMEALRDKAKRDIDTKPSQPSNKKIRFD